MCVYMYKIPTHTHYSIKHPAASPINGVKSFRVPSGLYKSCHKMSNIFCAAHTNTECALARARTQIAYRVVKLSDGGASSSSSVAAVQLILTRDDDKCVCVCVYLIYILPNFKVDIGMTVNGHRAYQFIHSHACVIGSINYYPQAHQADAHARTSSYISQPDREGEGGEST